MNEKATKKPRRQVTDVRRLDIVENAATDTGTQMDTTVGDFIRTLEIAALKEMRAK